jgi:hypothetical protein
MSKFPNMRKFTKPARRRHRRFAAELLEQRALLSAFVSEFPSPMTADAVSSAVARDQSAECSTSDGVPDLEIDHSHNDGDARDEAKRSARDRVPDLEIDHSHNDGDAGHEAERSARDGVQDVKNDHADNHGDAGHEAERSARDGVQDVNNDHADNHGDAGHGAERSASDGVQDLKNDHADNHRDAGHVAERPASDGVQDLKNDHADNHGDAGHVAERSASDGVQDLKIDHASNDRDAGREIGVVELPDAVVVAANSRLSGATIEAAEQVTTRTPSAEAASLASVSPKGPQTAQHDDRPANNAADPTSRETAAINAATDEKHFDHTDATRLAAVSDTSGTTAQVMSFSSTNATSATKLPLMSRLLTDVLSQDLATIERGLQEFLDGVNSLTDTTGEDSAARRWLPTLLTAAVAVYGAQQLISERRKSTRNSVLAAASQSSWSWVLNLSTSSDSKEQ